MNKNPNPYCALQTTLIDALEAAMMSYPSQRDDRLWFILELFIPNYQNAGLSISETTQLADFLDDMITANSLQVIQPRPCLIEPDHILFPEENRDAA